MPKQNYILRREVTLKHDKTGLPFQSVTYFETINGFVMGTTDPSRARLFATKALAEFFARNRLAGRGYKPEAIGLQGHE